MESAADFAEATGSLKSVAESTKSAVEYAKSAVESVDPWRSPRRPRVHTDSAKSAVESMKSAAESAKSTVESAADSCVDFVKIVGPQRSLRSPRRCLRYRLWVTANSAVCEIRGGVCEYTVDFADSAAESMQSVVESTAVCGSMADFANCAESAKTVGLCEVCVSVAGYADFVKTANLCGLREVCSGVYIVCGRLREDSVSAQTL